MDKFYNHRFQTYLHIVTIKNIVLIYISHRHSIESGRWAIEHINAILSISCNSINLDYNVVCTQNEETLHFTVSFSDV